MRKFLPSAFNYHSVLCDASTTIPCAPSSCFGRDLICRTKAVHRDQLNELVPKSTGREGKVEERLARRWVMVCVRVEFQCSLLFHRLWSRKTIFVTNS